MINTLFLWAALLIVTLLIELGAPGLFYFLSLALGSAGAALLSYYNFDFTWQLAACLAISCAAVIVLRFFVSREKEITLPTNMQALIGIQTMVLEPITATHPGLIKIYGDMWLAREKHNQPVAAGDEVTVVDIQGCHLIVKKNGITS